MRQRDRAWMGEGQRERETQNLKQAPGSEPSAQSLTRGSNSRTARSWPEPKSDAQPTEPPMRPETAIWISRLSKEDPPHPWGWMSSNLLGPEQEKKKKKVEKGQICSLCLSWDIHFLLPSDIRAPGSWAFGLGLNYPTGFPTFLRCKLQGSASMIA